MHRANEEAPDRTNSAGSDFLQLDITDAPTGRRSEWLAERLHRAIAERRLPVGSRLPASRVLAGELRVSRGVVTEAYRRLSDAGHVVGRGRGGTVVVTAPVGTGNRGPARIGPVAEINADPFVAVPGADVFDLLRAAPARIDLTPGVPDLAAFPRAGWLRAERQVLGGLASADLGYGDPRGAPPLRVAVAHWLARNRGIVVEPAEVVVVAGVAQSLGLLAEVLRAGGLGAMAVEDPGSLGVRQHLSHHGLQVPPVEVDTEGLRVDVLRRVGAAAVLLTPAHQFPTGVVLSGARRRELTRWTDAGGLVLEDDYDAEHRYDRPPVPALRAVRPERVCYTGSVSKLLAPALRIGWLLVPREHLDAVVAAKRFADLGCPVLTQLVLARLMDSGELERHLRMLRGRHRRRRDAMITAIRRHLPGAVVHGAAAGLHLTVTLAARVNDVELAGAALTRGVKVQPLSWHSQRSRPEGPDGLVLGYAARTAGEIDAGMSVLGELARR